jgi:hypothetical protein
MLWAKRWDSPWRGFDYASDVVVDRWGNVTVCGLAQEGAAWNWAVVSWSAAGAKRWSWTYRGAGNGTDAPQEMTVDANGNVYVTGWAFLKGGVYGAMTVKFSKAGARLWTRTYKGAEGIGGSTNAITRAPGGGVYVCGWQGRSATSWDTLIMKYTASGARTVFPKHVSDSAGTEDLFDIAVLPNGDVLVGGTTAGNAIGAWFSPAGQYKYANLAMSPQDDSFGAVGVDTAGGAYLAGHWWPTTDDTEVLLWRVSRYPGGGGWFVKWGGGNAAVDRLSALATKGTSAFVVGQHWAGPPQGWNGFIYGCEY